MKNTLRFLIIFGAGAVAGHLWHPSGALEAQAAKRVFELRTYTTNEGKLPNLNARFRDHTMRIFEKHGMTNVGYWVPQDAPTSANTLIYVIQHADRDAAKKSWAAFTADPEWVKVSADSQKDGRIVAKVDSVFMEPTDYSPIK
jgi:hypothetical protein